MFRHWSFEIRHSFVIRRSTLVIGKRSLLLRRLFFQPRDFFDAPRMPASFEGRGQPNLDHAIDEPLAEHVGREAENIEIVVPPASSAVKSSWQGAARTP